MPTKLTYAISRETTRTIGQRPIIFTLAPSGAQNEALIGLHLKGKRTHYVIALSDIYRMAALWHGQKEAKARREARKQGIPWHRAKKQFLAANTIPTTPRPKPLKSDTFLIPPTAPMIPVFDLTCPTHKTVKPAT